MFFWGCFNNSSSVACVGSNAKADQVMFRRALGQNIFYLRAKKINNKKSRSGQHFAYSGVGLACMTGTIDAPDAVLGETPKRARLLPHLIACLLAYSSAASLDCLPACLLVCYLLVRSCVCYLLA